jgi:hypothetical protein
VSLIDRKKSLHNLLISNPHSKRGFNRLPKSPTPKQTLQPAKKPSKVQQQAKSSKKSIAPPPPPSRLPPPPGGGGGGKKKPSKKAKRSTAAKKGWQTRRANIAAKLEAKKERARLRKLKQREIKPKLKEHLLGPLAKKEHVVKGTNRVRTAHKIETSTGFHIRREVVLMFDEPLPLELALLEFEPWAYKQLELFEKFIFNKYGVVTTIMIHTKTFGVWGGDRVRHHWDSAQVSSQDLAQHMETFGSLLDAFLKKDPSPKIKKSGKPGRQRKARTPKAQLPGKVIGFSLHMSTTNMTKEGIKQAKQLQGSDSDQLHEIKEHWTIERRQQRERAKKALAQEAETLRLEKEAKQKAKEFARTHKPVNWKAEQEAFFKKQ